MGNDKLDKEEFEAFQHPEHFEHMKRLVVRETIDSLDKDKDGMISEEEYFGLWPEDEPGSTRLDPEWKKIVRKEFREVRDEDGDLKLDDVEVKNWIVPDISEHVKMEAEHLIEEAD